MCGPRGPTNVLRHGFLESASAASHGTLGSLPEATQTARDLGLQNPCWFKWARPTARRGTLLLLGRAMQGGFCAVKVVEGRTNSTALGCLRGVHFIPRPTARCRRWQRLQSGSSGPSVGWTRFTDGEKTPLVYHAD